MPRGDHWGLPQPNVHLLLQLSGGIPEPFWTLNFSKRTVYNTAPARTRLSFHLGPFLLSLPPTLITSSPLSTPGSGLISLCPLSLFASGASRSSGHLCTPPMALNTPFLTLSAERKPFSYSLKAQGFSLSQGHSLPSFLN